MRSWGSEFGLPPLGPKSWPYMELQQQRENTTPQSILSVEEFRLAGERHGQLVGFDPEPFTGRQGQFEKAPPVGAERARDRSIIIVAISLDPAVVDDAGQGEPSPSLLSFLRKTSPTKLNARPH